MTHNENNMLVIGHRGAPAYEPENTLRSFRKALDIGVEMIELDVYLVDDQLVVIHDDKVDRTTKGTGYVWDYPFEELRKLDAGKGEKIPTLQEVLDCVDKRCAVNIELKGPGTAKPVSGVIEKYIAGHGWQRGAFIVSSFRHAELAVFKELSPSVAIGALVARIPLDYARFAEELGAEAVNVDLALVDQAYMDDAHRRGLKVNVFTVNEPDDIARMKELGVDGIFSNAPDVALAALRGG